MVADPPWKFADGLGARGAEAQYACMDMDAIYHEMASVLAQWDSLRASRDAVLFLWRVAAMQLEALSVAEDLGFAVKAELVWEKLTKTGQPHFGMGRYVRNSHEVCLIAVRGRALPAVRNVRSRFAAPVREHSRKPDAFYRLVEQLYPISRKVEMFARTSRVGWVQHGHERRKFDAE
jgi:N6-adenosine-specific RNA methylase IME4